MTPPNSEPPTLGEALRRLDEVVRQLSDLAREMKTDRIDAGKTYVRQDMYIEARNFDAAITADLHGDIASLKADTTRDLASLKEDRKADIAFRRQVLLAFAIAGVGWLLSVALTVATFLAR